MSDKIKNNKEKDNRDENATKFTERANQIQNKYGHLIDFESKQYQDVLMDIIEIWEDMERLHPLYSGIVKGKFSDKEFKNAIGIIEAWAWHTSDHLANLNKALSEADN